MSTNLATVYGQVDLTDLLSNRVADHIRRAIRDGSLRSGDKLNEASIAETFSVSKTPVREALRLLETQGLVEILPRRGAFVKTFDLKGLVDIANLRATLESLAVRLGVKADKKEGWIRQLRDITSRMRESSLGKPLNDLHEDFHKVLVSRSGNDKLNQILMTLQTQVSTFLYLIHELYDDSMTMADEHDAIVDVIATGDVSTIGIEVENHALDGLERLVAHWNLQANGPAT